MKAILTRAFTKGVEIRAERSGIIIKNRWRFLSKSSIDAYSSYKSKNVTLIGQTITPHERVSSILRFLATGRSYEDLKYSE